MRAQRGTRPRGQRQGMSHAFAGVVPRVLVASASVRAPRERPHAALRRRLRGAAPARAFFGDDAYPATLRPPMPLPRRSRSAFVRGERREDGARLSQRRVETSDRRGGRAGAGAGRRGIRRRLESAQPRRRRRRAGKAVQRADDCRRGRRAPAAGPARRARGRAAGAAAPRREDPLRRAREPPPSAAAADAAASGAPDAPDAPDAPAFQRTRGSRGSRASMETSDGLGLRGLGVAASRTGTLARVSPRPQRPSARRRRSCPA